MTMRSITIRSMSEARIGAGFVMGSVRRLRNFNVHNLNDALPRPEPPGRNGHGDPVRGDRELWHGRRILATEHAVNCQTFANVTAARFCGGCGEVRHPTARGSRRAKLFVLWACNNAVLEAPRCCAPFCHRAGFTSPSQQPGAEDQRIVVNLPDSAS
jgi:hypothetical protein